MEGIAFVCAPEGALGLGPDTFSPAGPIRAAGSASGGSAARREKEVNKKAESRKQKAEMGCRKDRGPKTKDR